MDMWNSLAGYVMIKIEGVGLERFINRAIREGLEVWNIARPGRNTMTACVSIGSFYALRRLNRSLGCRITILEKHGLPIALSRLRFRKVLLFGWVLVLAALLIASRYVWFLQIEGCDRVTEAEIIETLTEMGIVPGTPRGQVKTSSLGQAVMASDQRIAWAGAELYGVVLQVSIQEASETPAILQEGEPASLYAAKDGVIRRITPLSGKALFHAGDGVLKGQELITGDLGNGIQVEARGEVIARVLYRFSYTAPYTQVLPGPSGNTFTYTEISLGEWTAPPPEIPFADYEAERGKTRILGAGLPLSATEVVCHELVAMPQTLTAQELAPIALAGAREKMEAEVEKTARILSTQEEYSQDEQGVTAVLHVIAEENIAQSGALQTKDE